ncbi:hypothetical protein JQ629_18275 [Bradyrhizobium sp. AUGA SZCCT0222]|uniref:hypothetical protein n=1 Tax=Bradyrhizobium sp. AUGA SZCCT0222 TaxID=2807668 RepID=UPI001BACBC83|nr:hypothetical protein [Bradyrhizobium sp. AUGA SZCCT0222]MBR1269463.1 hypothetical protein [Bradyrhizobium sp. AUGA SZCCT0222]
MGKMDALDAAMLAAIAEAGACLKQDGSLRAAKRLLNQTVARDACEGPTAETMEQKALLGSANQVERSGQMLISAANASRARYRGPVSLRSKLRTATDAQLREFHFAAR